MFVLFRLLVSEELHSLNPSHVKLCQLTRTPVDWIHAGCNRRCVVTVQMFLTHQDSHTHCTAQRSQRLRGTIACRRTKRAAVSQKGCETTSLPLTSQELLWCLINHHHKASCRGFKQSASWDAAEDSGQTRAGLEIFTHFWPGTNHLDQDPGLGSTF